MTVTGLGIFGIALGMILMPGDFLGPGWNGLPDNPQTTAPLGLAGRRMPLC